MPRLVDIGVNLMHAAFSRDREAVVRQAEDAGVSPLVITGTNAAGSREAAEYATLHPGKLYATAGVHPHEVKNCSEDTLPDLRETARIKTVIAVGECGLDYNRDFSPRAVQREWLVRQAGLAVETGLPLFLHERDAFPDFAAILAEFAGRAGGFVVHCFTGTAKALETYLSFGAYIGVTGWICDERRGSLLAGLIRDIPPDRLLVETDAPFLFPRGLVRHGGKSGRNEPRFLPHIVSVMAGLLGKDPEQLAGETQANTFRLFGRLTG
ncbi:MAG: TatD family hydrolase [Spirochaetaceae bacterium]|jgi:TatD DNase family protein|nr:TatD family hydrolase [Spirochaetaceae bacterium]